MKPNIALVNELNGETIDLEPVLARNRNSNASFGFKSSIYLKLLLVE